MVALISSKVSTTLEEFDIATAGDRVPRVFDSANLSAKIDPRIVDTLREYVPPEYAVIVISPSGAMRSSIPDALTPSEVDYIRRIGSGDSSAFNSPHVAVFAKLKDGSILVM